MSSFTSIAAEVGDLVTRKNASYGDALTKTAEVLAVRFPHGIQPAEYLRFLSIARIDEKLFRAATNSDPDGESPFLDIAGHAIVALRNTERMHECGFVSAAEFPSPAPNDSAKQPAPAPTMPNANASSGRSSRPPLSTESPSISGSAASIAPTAAKPSSSLEDVLVQARARAYKHKCPWCTANLLLTWVYPSWTPQRTDRFDFCSLGCGGNLNTLLLQLGSVR